MVIGTKRLLELVKEINLVENLSERELTNPEGEGFDFRVQEVYKLGLIGGFLGVTDRRTPPLISLAKYGKKKGIIIKPREYRLVKTIEKINLPNNISTIFTPRTTLQRSGILLITSNASPEYYGELTFGMYNLSDCPFQLELGARICTAIFSETTENISGYRGQWKGGRGSTEGKTEKQV